MPRYTRDELRAVSLKGIDSALQHTWIITGENRALLSAYREVIRDDDTLLDKVLTKMTFYSPLEGESSMSHKMEAVNWAGLLDKLKLAAQNAPAIIATVEGLIALFTVKVPVMKSAVGDAACVPCCHKAAVQKLVDDLAGSLVEATMLLECCDDSPAE